MENTKTQKTLLAALEGGGTKMVCALGYTDGESVEWVDRRSFPTESPETTLPALIRYFAGKGVQALGMGSFGPVDLRPDSPTWGYITTTPKPGWQFTPIAPMLGEALGVPVGFETDVNVAAIGEAQLGAGRAARGRYGSLLYVTVGTGCGAGFVSGGKALHGLVHPEPGHFLLRPRADDPAPDGFCPFHKGCLEGLASGPAVEKRWGVKAAELPESHPAWDLEAEYLAQFCANAVFAYSPDVIVLGGGVMHQAFLFPRIRKRMLDLLGGYIQSERLLDAPETYLVPPALGDDAGITGALLTARAALR